MQKKAWTTTFLFKVFLSFFKRLVPSGMFPTNHRLLILDGHGSHIYFTSNRTCANQFGLNMVILPSHTTHVLQPLDVSCFNPFKKERDGTMVRNNYNKPNEVTLARWVDNLGYKDLVTKSKVYRFVHGTT